MFTVQCYMLPGAGREDVCDVIFDGVQKGVTKCDVAGEGSFFLKIA